MSDHSKPLPVLPQIEIRTPCPMSWDEMQGSDSKRFCDHCQKHVHKFAEMDEQSVACLLNSGERVCAQIHRRADGSIVTKSARITRRNWLARLGSLAAGVIGLLTLGGCSKWAPKEKTGGTNSPEIDPDPITGIVAPEPPDQSEPPPEVLMGDVAYPEDI